MRIVLHIGSPKTGTTALQRVLATKRGALAKAGVCYPALPPESNHSILSVPFYADSIPRQYWQGAGTDKAAADAVAMAYWDSVVRQFEAQEGADTLLLSGEHFLEIDDHAALLAHLRQLFAHTALAEAEVTVLCYLRDPVAYYETRLLQHLKAAWQPYWPRRECWPEALHGWQEVGQLRLRAYDPDQLVGGDIVADVLSVLDIEGLKLPSLRVNQSLSAAAHAVLSQYRRYIHTEHENAFLPDCQRLEAVLRKAEERLQPHRRRSALTAVARGRALQISAPVVQALEADFGLRFATAAQYEAAAQEEPLPPAPEGAAFDDIFQFDTNDFEHLQAEALAHLLQGLHTRGQQQ